MSLRVPAALLCSLALAGQLSAMPAPESPTTEMRANENAQKISSAEEFLAEINLATKMARAGEYGKISKQDLVRLDEAKATVEDLLTGVQSARDLKPEQRIELYDTQLLITSIIRDDEKNRRVCTRIRSTGSRLTKMECLTVEQREERAERGQLNTLEMQRAAPCEPIKGQCGPAYSTYSGGR